MEEYDFEALLKKYMPMMRSMASTYNIRGADIEDLVQELSIALWNSSKCYDPNKGGKESSFYFNTFKRCLITLYRHSMAKCRGGDFTILSLDDENLIGEKIKYVNSHNATTETLDDHMNYLMLLEMIVKLLNGQSNKKVQKIMYDLIFLGYNTIETGKRNNCSQMNASYYLCKFRDEFEKQAEIEGMNLSRKPACKKIQKGKPVLATSAI